MSHTLKRKSGFSLLELLVVMAIIAILGALLLEAVAGVKGRARRITCLNNLRQIDLGVRMYSDDSNDKAPKPAKLTGHPYAGYKELMKSYVGSKGASSVKDRLFACPADVYYYDYAFGRHAGGPWEGYVPEGWCIQSNSDYSSYVFNAGNMFNPTNSAFRPGIAGVAIGSIKHPSRTVLVTEAPALLPFSWHHPKWPLYIVATSYCPNMFFNDAMNMVSYVDGHVSYVKIYWKTSVPPVFLPACAYDPPDGYDYQWSGN